MEEDRSQSSSLVLLAEDDDDFLMIAKLALEHVRFTGILQIVRSKEDLMAFLRERAIPALIIMDFHVPSNDWQATIRDLKAQESYKHIPIVVLTSSRDRESGPFERFPRCSYLQKPVSFKGWKAYMEHILRKYLSAKTPGPLLIDNENPSGRVYE